MTETFERFYARTGAIPPLVAGANIQYIVETKAKKARKS